jgi:hypothetical protein
MNSETLMGSLIFTAVSVMVIALLIQLMMRGWRHRALRQAALIGTLPAIPDTVGSAIVAPTDGMYVGSTLTPSWHDRVAVGDLGYRSKAVMTRYPEGIMVQRSGATPIWIPQQSITGVHTQRGIAGKVTTRNGILAIRWRLPSGTEIDTGFRGKDRDEYARWLSESAG